MTTFYLVRHAERMGDQLLLVGRREGVHLTAAGRRQAECLAHHLSREPIDQLYSSPLERARETGQAIAHARGIEVNISAAFHEVDAGAWTGKTFPELDAGDEHWRRFNQFRSVTRIPGGEAMIEVQTRFVSEMLRLHDVFPDAGIVLVSHGDPIKVALTYFLGAPLDFYERIEIGLASVSIVALHPWGAKVLRVNEVPHEHATPTP